ncbi:MAG TPA: cytochrome c [Candidatus Binataceae bacterium]
MKLALASIVFAAATVACARGFAAESVVYQAKCAVCHQAAGQGVAGVYPPLADSIGAYLRVAEGRRYLASVVVFGMSGPIEVAGQTYNGLMLPQGDLTDAQLAGALNFVLESFDAKLLPQGFKAIAPEELKRARAAHLTAGDLSRQRQAMLEALKHAGGASAAIR